MKKLIFPVIFLTMLVMSVCVYALDVERDLKGMILRLHVIANSDSEYDQNIKLAVRDAVLSSVRGTDPVDTEAIKKAAEAAACSYLEKNNIPYSARTEYGLFHFPKKQYKNITLPSGDYQGIRVILGSGSGHNWWCIMYPPLCVEGDTAVAAEAALSELHGGLHDDTYELILNDKKIRFRLIELLDRIKTPG